MKHILQILLVAAAALGSGSCKHSSAPEEKPIITVSIEPQRWLLERIVGDRMNVRTLMARGGNPESYEPTFSHLAELERSRCYMKVGNLGFETAMVEKIKSELPELKIVDTSDSIELITDAHGHDHGIDPHVWSSATNARIMARNMLDAVTDIDPEGTPVYRANYRRLTAAIDSVDSICANMLLPMKGNAFLVWHPSLSYFARDYGLHQISVGAEGKEHSVSDTRDVVDYLKADSAVVFLIQKDFDTAKAGTIAKDYAGIRISSINPLNYEWDTELLQTAGAIAGR